MGAESTVTDRLSTMDDMATANNDAAVAAMEALADIELPIATDPGIGYTPIAPVYPVEGTRATPVDVTDPPDPYTPAYPDQPEIPDPVDIDQTRIALDTIFEITMPDPPEIDIQPLDLEAPEYTITDPLPWSFEVGDILISDDPMIQAILNRLTSNIANGGTGLTAAIEAAIWDRDKERSLQALSDATDRLTGDWAKRGFSLPTGMLAHSLAELQKEYMNRNIDRSREIAIKQAELEQTNLFKSMELGVGLASKLIELLTRYQELVFKGQEATAKFANEYIDIQVRTYASLVEIYKAKAQTYEIIIRGETAKIDLYKAELEAQRLIGTVNEQTVKIYSEKIQATKLIFERFREEVASYAALITQERAKIEDNKNILDEWAKGMDVRIANYNGQVEQYRSESNINVAHADVQGRTTEANLRAQLAYCEMVIKKFESMDRTSMLGAQIRMEAAKGIAANASSLAAGAMAALHTAATIGYTESKTLA